MTFKQIFTPAQVLTAIKYHSDVVTASMIGIACHTVILVVAIIDAALINKYFYERLILSLALIPMIRIISLSLPLADISRI